MSGDILNLQITILTPNGEIAVSVTPRATDRVSELMARLILEHALMGEPENWQLKFENHPLSLELSLREVLPSGPNPASLTLTPTGATLPFGIPGLSGGIRPPAARVVQPPRSDGTPASGTHPASHAMRLSVTILTDFGNLGSVVTMTITDSVADLIAQLMQDFKLSGPRATWEVLHDDRILPPSSSTVSRLDSL